MKGKTLVSVVATSALVFAPIGSLSAYAISPGLDVLTGSASSVAYWENVIYQGDTFKMEEASVYSSVAKYLSDPRNSGSSISSFSNIDAFDGFGDVTVLIGGTRTSLFAASCGDISALGTAQDPTNPVSSVSVVCSTDIVPFDNDRDIAGRVTLTFEENWFRYALEAKILGDPGSIKAAIGGNLGSETGTEFHTPASGEFHWVTSDALGQQAGVQDPVLAFRTTTNALALKANYSTLAADGSGELYLQSKDPVTLGADFVPVLTLEGALFGWSGTGFSKAVSCAESMIQESAFGTATSFFVDSTTSCPTDPAAQPPINQIPSGGAVVNQPKGKFVAQGTPFSFTGSGLANVSSVSCNGLNAEVIATSPTSVKVLVPMELGPGSVTCLLSLGGFVVKVADAFIVQGPARAKILSRAKSEIVVLVENAIGRKVTVRVDGVLKKKLKPSKVSRQIRISRLPTGKSRLVIVVEGKKLFDRVIRLPARS